MAVKHSKNEKKSKAPVIIIIVVALIAVIAAVFAVLYFNGAFGSKDNKPQENTTPTASAVPYTTAQAMHGQDQTSAQSSEQSSAQEQTNVVVVPTEAEGDVTHFNATFIPNGKVIDTVSGVCSPLTTTAHSRILFLPTSLQPVAMLFKIKKSPQPTQTTKIWISP